MNVNNLSLSNYFIHAEKISKNGCYGSCINQLVAGKLL